MNKQRVWIIVGAVLVIFAACWFLNFRVAVSNTQSEAKIITTGMGDRLPDAMQRRDKINLAVVGDNPLVNPLRSTLARQLRDAGLGEVEIVSGLQPVFPNPVLIVIAGQPGPFWTPVFATSHFPVQAGYASNGDTTFMGKTAIAYDNQNGPILNLHAEYTVTDTSWGLISRPGYHQILADHLAGRIATALKDLYKVP